MIKIENVETCNWRAAIRGMRNPLESWQKSDSYFADISAGDFTNLNEEFMNCVPDHVQDVYLGEADLKLMKSLVNAGTDHSKFMRMITVSFDITAPLYWWKEFDTYKIGTVRNSCSTMHKIEARPLTIDDFATDGLVPDDIGNLIDYTNYINLLIEDYKKASGEDKLKIHRRIVKLLPDSYLQRATITTNYQVLRSIRNSDRKTHKLLEWQEDFMKFIDSLPYAKELLIEDEEFKYIKALDFVRSYKLKNNYTMTREEIEDDNKVTVFFNDALNGIKTYAEKKDPCAGLTCYEEKEDGVYYRCAECTHTYNVAECYHYYECAKKGTGVAIPDKDNVKGLVIEPGAFNGEEF